MQNLRDTLTEVMRTKGLSASSFERKIGVDDTHIHMLLTRAKTLSPEMKSRIFKLESWDGDEAIVKLLLMAHFRDEIEAMGLEGVVFTIEIKS